MRAIPRPVHGQYVGHPLILAPGAPGRRRGHMAPRACEVVRCDDEIHSAPGTPCERRGGRAFRRHGGGMGIGIFICGEKGRGIGREWDGDQGGWDGDRDRIGWNGMIEGDAGGGWVWLGMSRPLWLYRLTRPWRPRREGTLDGKHLYDI